MLAQLASCEAAGVELLCCPESVIGELANESDGDSPAVVALNVDELTEVVAPLLASAMTIVVGFTERMPGGEVSNAAAVLSDGEVAGIYRKVYPGTGVCLPGEDLPVFRHGDVHFGVLICNDAHYVEPARVLASRGAQLLVVPVHGGHRAAKEAAWRARGTNVLIARAVENAVPLVAADVAGHQGERLSHGTTCVIDSQGTVVARGRELVEDLVIADVDVRPGQLGGGIDGSVLGRANPAVTRAFLDLYE